MLQAQGIDRSRFRAQGSYAEAEPLYRRSLAIKEKAFGPEHPDVALSLNNLALLYDAQGNYAEAELLYRRALTINEKTLGPEHPDVATNLNNLAWLYHNQGDYAEAEALYRLQGDLVDADTLYVQALSIFEGTLGPEHPIVATLLDRYVILLREAGRTEEAHSVEARAEAIRSKLQ